MNESVTPTGADNLPPRDGKGKWRRGIDSVERDAEACRLHVAGWTYQRISDELGYGSKSNVSRAISRVLTETMQEPADEVRALLRARNEEIYVLARDIALKQHLAHSQGKVIYDGASKVYDDEPKLKAMDRMQRALTEIGKLTGAHAPQKFENLSLEAVQAEIARLEAEERQDGVSS